MTVARCGMLSGAQCGAYCDAHSTTHCGPEQPKIQTEVLGHLLVYSIVRSNRSLVRSLAHFAHSLTRGTVNYQTAIYSLFSFILAHSATLRQRAIAYDVI